MHRFLYDAVMRELFKQRAWNKATYSKWVPDEYGGHCLNCGHRKGERFRFYASSDDICPKCGAMMEGEMHEAD